MSLELSLPQKPHFPLLSPITSLGILITLKVSKDTSYRQWFVLQSSRHTGKQGKCREVTFTSVCFYSCLKIIFIFVQHFLHVRSPVKMQSLQNTSSMKCRAGLQLWDAGSNPGRLTLTDSPVTSAGHCNNSWVPLRL